MLTIKGINEHNKHIIEYQKKYIINVKIFEYIDEKTILQKISNIINIADKNTQIKLINMYDMKYYEQNVIENGFDDVQNEFMNQNIETQINELLSDDKQDLKKLHDMFATKYDYQQEKTINQYTIMKLQFIGVFSY